MSEHLRKSNQCVVDNCYHCNELLNSKVKMKSAGFIIECNGKYLICHSTSLDGKFSFTDQKWGVPKGLVESGENLLGTAARETLEETNLDVFALHDEGSIEIHMDVKFYYKTSKKHVHIFLATAKTDITTLKLNCRSKIMPFNVPENDAFKWVEWDTAYDMVSKRQKELFSKENRKIILDKLK